MWFLFGVSAAVHLAIAAGMAGPVIQGDEGAYLGTASALARGTGLLYRPSPFQPGWSVLLWPVERLTSNPADLYRAALLLNGLCLSSVVVIAYAATRWFIDPSAVEWRMAAAAVVAAYPPFLAYSNVALEISVFIPLCALGAYTAGRCAERPTWSRWAAMGAVAGACYAVHAIGGAVIAAAIGLAVVVRRPLRQRLTAVVATLAGVQVTGVAALVLVERVIRDDRRVAGPAAVAVVSRGKAVVGLYNHNATLHHHFILLGYEIAGQVWYLAAATLGLAVIGGMAAAQATWRVVWRGSSRPGDFFAVFAGFVALAGLWTSAARFIVGPNGSGQADALIYGRYNEHVLAPLLILGVAQLGALATRRGVALGIGAVAVTAGSGAVLDASRSAAGLHAPIVYLNVMGLQPALEASGRIDIALISAGAIGAVILVLVLVRWQGLLVVAPLLVAAGVASAAYSASTMVSDSHQRQLQRVVIHAVGLVDRTAGPVRCVAYDKAISMEWTTANDQTFLPTVRFVPFDSATAGRPCSPLVLTQRLDLATSYPGARLMAAENYAASYLWILPGAVQDRLGRAGMLLPPGFPTALPAGAYRSQVRVLGSATTKSSVQLRLAVSNRGKGAPWLSERSFPAAATKGWVSVVAVLIPIGPTVAPASVLFAGAVRSQLPRELWPGETDIQTVTLDQVGGSPLAAGRYQLTLGLVQEGYSYFAQRGDPPVRLDLVVK
jgi:hypothetical protein